MTCRAWTACAAVLCLAEVSALVEESPHYYCDACVTTLEEFYWALQDETSTKTRRQVGASDSSSELRLDMVRMVEQLCHQPRMTTYRDDIKDGCSQITQSNFRPLILEFTGPTVSCELTHTKIDSFCAQRLGVCPKTAGRLQTLRAGSQPSKCSECVFAIKDTWNVLNRHDQSPQGDQNEGPQKAAKRTKAQVWDAIERICDGIILRHGRRSEANDDDCLDLVAEYDTEIASALIEGRRMVQKIPSKPLSLPSPVASKAESSVLRNVTYDICVASTQYCSELDFASAFEDTLITPWLWVRGAG